jgi:hypothetical protein
MAETNNEVVNNGTEVPGEAKPLSRIQEEALQQGWVPKEEFQGEEDAFIDAAEFVRRGELFRKIESQSKEMKELRKALNSLAGHNAKIREVEYKRAMDDLKAQKKTALSEGDADRVVELDDQIDLVKEQQRIQQTQQIQQVSTEVHPELANWVSKNSWYETNPEMRKFADRLGAVLAADMSPTDVLKEVEKEVKERFKDKFRNPNRDKASAVEGVKTRPQTSRDSEPELSDVEKTVMKTLVDGGHITREEYLKQLKAVKSKA